MACIKPKNLTYVRIDNLYGPYGLTICVIHSDCWFIWIIQIVNPYEPYGLPIWIVNPYVRQFFFFALQQRKFAKIHCILLTNTRTPSKTKYAFKPSLTKATYTKSQKFCKKNGTVEMKNWTCYLQPKIQ